jgi:hypothetical protein
MNQLSHLRKGRLLLVVLCLGLFTGLAVTAARSSSEAPQRVTVSVDEAAPGAPVPADFIGLSYEVKDLPLVASLGGRGNLVALLRSLGRGVLRFGGVTADSQVAWRDPATAPLPAWATTRLVPADLYSLARLARATDWSVVLTVNLVHFDPAVAADEARVARLALGSSLRAIEIGNEPTAFVAEHLRHGTYPFAVYRQEIAAYRAAIQAVVPGLAIDGPDNEPLASNPHNLAWAQAEAREVHPTLLTGHLYGASKCSRVPPTALLLLGSEVHSGEATALRALETVARTYNIAVWLDETNNISCGGQPGVSDSYATALWALDLLTRTLKSPFVGDAFHGFIQKATGYSPIVALSPVDLTRGTLTVRPEWYALLLAHEVEGDRPLPVKIRPAGLNVAVWAGLTPSGNLHLIVDNEQPQGSRPLQIQLDGTAVVRSASILRLDGPVLTATSGVTLSGMSVAAYGTWTAGANLSHAERSHGIFSVLVAPMSAVLVTTEQHTATVEVGSAEVSATTPRRAVLSSRQK